MDAPGRIAVVVRCVVAALWLAWSGAALAGPPLETDDPETPGVNGWEVNIAHTLEKTRHSLGMAVPRFDVNYGLLENDQWKIEFPIEYFDVVGDGHHWGVGDVLLGWKYRFVDEDDRGWMASIYPQLLVPTGNERVGIGGGETAMLLPVELGKHFFDDKLFVYGEVGYNVVFDEPQANSWKYGVAAEWKLTEKLDAVFEVGGYAFPGHVEPDNPFFHAGFRYALGERASLIAAFGRSFRGDRFDVPELTSYVGFQFAWGGKKAEEQGDGG